jgi:hypothetical protein
MALPPAAIQAPPSGGFRWGLRLILGGSAAVLLMVTVWVSVILKSSLRPSGIHEGPPRTPGENMMAERICWENR